MSKNNRKQPEDQQTSIFMILMTEKEFKIDSEKRDAVLQAQINQLANQNKQIIHRIEKIERNGKE